MARKSRISLLLITFTFAAVHVARAECTPFEIAVLVEHEEETDSWFTLYTLVGLWRHADHHAHASRPYHQLRYFEESPKLPYGYFGTTVLALFAPARLRWLLTSELERRQLGPFAVN